MSDETKINLPENANILQRINAVRRVVSYVQKDENKIDGQYRAVTHDSVTALLHQPMVDAGIIMLPRVEESHVVETGKSTRSQTPIIRYEATFVIYFCSEASLDDAVRVRIEAHAEDTGDKAPGKALSYACKYAKLKVFDLETGEDDESRIQAAPRTLSDDSYKMLVDVCIELGFDADEALAAIAKGIYKVDGIMSINNQWAEDAAQRLRNRARLEAACAEHATTIQAIKDGIATQDYSTAIEAWEELTDEQKGSIWIAPTKAAALGAEPPFTTAERDTFKTNEWHAAKKAYYGNKETS